MGKRGEGLFSNNENLSTGPPSYAMCSSRLNKADIEDLFEKMEKLKTELGVGNYQFH